jgi:integration host factor subunit beta
MTKKDIAKAIAAKTGIPLLETQKVVQKTMDAAVETLIAERRIELRGFGVFEVKKRAARNARNLRTGEKAFASEKLIVKFKPSIEMEGRARSQIGRTRPVMRPELMEEPVPSIRLRTLFIKCYRLAAVLTANVG